ncbi:MAG: DedA family protein [Desulfarculales bacterium]|jgi:membrane protein DedA with SNARE-associated domain|nr:DedA family protein [Desulfarculales bacterium]
MPALENLIAEYGYLAILIGTFLEGETILVLGGIAAAQGLLDIRLVMLAAFAGSYSGDQLAFAIGRKWGTKIMARKPKWQAKADYLLSKSPIFINIWMVAFRFFYGLRNPTPWILGSGRTVTFKKFLMLNGVGALLWAIGVAWGGYAFGMLLDHFLGQIKNIMLLILLCLAVLLPLGIWLWRRRRARRSAKRELPSAQTAAGVKILDRAESLLNSAQNRRPPGASAGK